MDNRHLYRGKRTDNGEWVQGYYYVLDGYHHILINEIERITGKAGYGIDVDPTTVSQCTGLTAVKSYRGAEPEDRFVYEGDIVRYAKWTYIVRCGIYNQNPKNCAPAYVVGWYLEGLGKMAGLTEPLYEIDGMAAKYPAHCADTPIGADNLKLEIIGNCWENPELLGVSEE